MKSITHKPVEGTGYRPDIDGLRAVAVLSVLFYHFGIDAFQGGYVGVDVFFVISGFLITRLIRDNIERGKFSFGNFYIRRVRRLFPAMFFTLVVTFLVASILFSPQHLERLGGSTLYAVLSISNFYFWGESGYFDAGAAFKPLLHFWSLSVEEQFYFVWPSVLVLLLTKIKFRYAPVVFIFLTGVGSLILAQIWLKIDTSAVFYLSPFRVVEFAFGAILVWLIKFRSKSAWLNEAILLLGLCLVFYPIFAYSHETLFPGINALIPCLGAALVIYSGNPRFFGKILTHKSIVFIGLISYSLYLCHWPIYVFYRYQNPADATGPMDIIFLTVASFFLATLMYRYVEVPFRYPSKTNVMEGASARFGLACALLALILVFPAAHSWANKGWFWRYGSTNLSQVFDLEQFRINSVNFNQFGVKSPVFTSWGKKVLVIGDSHSRDVANGLAQVLDPELFQVRRLNMDDACIAYLDKQGVINADKLVNNPRNCATQFKIYAETAKLKQADIFVFSAGFNPTSAQNLDRLIRLTQSLSNKPKNKIVVMDRTVGFTDFHSEAIKLMSNGTGFDEINKIAYRFGDEELLSDVYEALAKSTADFNNVVLVSKKKFLCDVDSCSFFLEDGNLAIWDNTHWTVGGAEYFMT